MKIIKFDKIKTRKELFKVFFDNGESVILTAETITNFRLRTNAELTSADYEKILTFDKSKKAVADALSLASKRSYSAKSLYDKLILKGYEPNDVKNAVNRLKELNYINDERYAKAYAEYLSGNGKGGLAIKAGLEKHNLPKTLINEVLESIKSEKDSYEQIIDLMKKKFKKFDSDDKSEVRRAAAFFLRRGFSSEDIAKAFRKYKNISLEEIR